MALTDNLVSYWKLDESSNGSGAVTRNDSHGSNHLTDNNTTPSGAGKIVDAASFTRANNEFLSVAHDNSLTPSLLTITGWINLAAATMGTSRGIWCKYSSAITTERSYVLFVTAANRLQWFVENAAGDTPSVTLSTVLSADTWYFVACRFDGANISVSVNAGTPATAVLTGTLDTSPSMQFRLGMYPSQTNGSAFGGLIDEVGFWSRALGDAEITQLYNSGNGLAYPFSFGQLTNRNRLTSLTGGLLAR